MTLLRLAMHDDPVVQYSLHADGERIGEVRPHAAHAAVLRIGPQAWWLADDVGTALQAAGASIARRVFEHLARPRRYSLREDGGERVLARAVRRTGWGAKANGLDCEIGGAVRRLRMQASLGGRFAFEDDAGRVLGQLELTGFAGAIQARGLPLALPEAAFLLYATHRVFGRDVQSTVGYA